MKTKRVRLKFYVDIPYETIRDVHETIDDIVTRTSFEFDMYNALVEPYVWRELTDDDNTMYQTYEEE